MQFFAVITVTLLVMVVSATMLPKRETSTNWESPFNGTIVAPISDDVVVAGTDFSFMYTASNWCRSSFSPFIVYLTEGTSAPVFEAVMENGTLAEGTYLHRFGQFTVSNFGLPNPDVPPPASLNVPLAVAKKIKSQSYLTVLQVFNGCPGHITREYSLVSQSLTVNIDE